MTLLVGMIGVLCLSHFGAPVIVLISYHIGMCGVSLLTHSDFSVFFCYKFVEQRSGAVGLMANLLVLME